MANTVKCFGMPSAGLQTDEDHWFQLLNVALEIMSSCVVNITLTRF